MPTYNPNDFYPSSGAKIDSQGNVRNTADGYNADGSENVVIEASKVVGPTKIASISYTTFTASTSSFTVTTGVLNRNATHRTFAIINSMDQTFSASPTITLHDSLIGGTGSLSGDSVSFASPAANGGRAYRTSEGNTGLASHVDSIMFSATMGATAPTKGTIDIWVIEVLGA